MDNSVKIDGVRGEVIFPLNGRDTKLRVSWKAVADIQTALGYGIVPLAVRISGHNYGVIEVAQIVYHGILAAETTPTPTFEKVCEEVFKAGILSVEIVRAITAFCELALNGGKAPAPGEGQAVDGKL